MQINKKLIRRWRFTALILAMTALPMPFSVQAQETQISLPSKELTAREVFDAIHDQTNYRIAVDKSSFSDEVKVKAGKSPMTVASVMQKLLAGSEHTYVMEGNHIIIVEEAAPAPESIVTLETKRSVVGIVYDPSGKPLEGVRITILKVADATAQTFSNGRFKINNVSPGKQVAKLVSPDGSIVRYREFTVPTGRDANVKFTMESDVLKSAVSVNEAEDPDENHKTTAYFVKSTVDPTIRAFSDEPKTEYSFIPTANTNKRHLPKVGLKTNLLPYAVTTPNLAIEFALGKRWTLDIASGYNPFRWEKGGINKMGYVQPEFRYWFCERFERHFIGLHGLYGMYNIGEVNQLTTTFQDHRYKGWAAGAGLSYGYHLPMGKRWAWEFTVGAGYVYLRYDKFKCYTCDEHLGERAKHYFGPTKAGISLIFMIK